MLALLRKQDGWARTPPPSEEAVRRLLNDPPATLREAMHLLNYGPVADYFAYRWSDPTYLSGLALLNLHEHTNVLELACGVGHYCREFTMRGIPITGVDVVYSKLWLAKKYVAPEASYVCLDAGALLPFPDKYFSTAFCHDAFYFLPNKLQVARELQRVAHTVLIGHTHNAAIDNHSSGAPLTVAEYASLFPGATVYDDLELTEALLNNSAPRAMGAGAAAIALAPASTGWTGMFTDPPPGAPLRPNPLLVGGQIVFPSERYRAEYGGLMGYLTSDRDPVRRRALVSLPERW